MRRALAAVGGVLALVLSGCAASSDGGGGVVVTTNILGDLTREIVGDAAPVTVLMKPNADPHSFGISAQQAAKLEQADLIVYNGLGLEEGVLRNVDSAADAGVPALEVGRHVDPMDFHGDEQDGEPDPHFWTDPQRARTAVETIADRVIADVDGIDEATVRANAGAYVERIGKLDAWMRERFSAIPADGRKLVTNHHVFGYLAQRYDFDVVGTVIPSGTTLASPSASDLSELAGTVRSTGVPAIFADSSQPDRLARVLADQAGVDVRVLSLYSESLTGSDGQAPTYEAMMRANTDTIVAGLGR